MRRHLLGMIALMLVLAGTIGLVLGEGSSSQMGLLASACVRAGCVLGALWLAFPQIVEISTRVPPWLIGVMLLGGLAVAIRPRSITVVAPLLAVLLGMHVLGFLLRPPMTKTRQKKMESGKRKARS